MAGAALLAAGCGTVGTVPANVDVSSGKTLFEQHCAACHTLADAKATGTVGPNLDNAIGDPRSQGFADSTLRDMVRGQIAYATAPMPRDLVKGVQADEVAAYVVQVAGKPGVSVRAAPPPGRTQTTTTTTTTATTATTTTAAAGSAQGKSIFVANCGSCHTLAAAGTNGTVGPNLDQKQPNKARVVKQVTNGGAIMPAFKGRLSPAQIDAVATYVAASDGSK